MITDGSKEQTSRGTAFQARLRKNRIVSEMTQKARPNQNPSETVIKIRAIFRTNCPRQLWTYGLPHFAKSMQLTATNAGNLKGEIPLGALLGKTPDISRYLDFGFYDWVWYKENAGLEVPELGRFLGINDSSTN